MSTTHTVRSAAWRSLIRIAVAGFVAALIATFAPANPANAVVKVPSWYRANGCTAPFPGTFNTLFRGPCNTHDVCYDWVRNRQGSAGRQACDNEFYWNMEAVCLRSYARGTAGRNVCLGGAVAYYSAVRQFGAPFFNNPYLN